MTQVHKNHAILLIGLPGSGKSTYARNFVMNNSDYIILSSDNIIERLAKEEGKVYNDEAYVNYRDIAEREYKCNLGNAINKKLNIIVDRTNQTIAARRKILSRLPKTYKKTAIIFNVTRDELNKRLEKRRIETGKEISQQVLDTMVGFYVEPSMDEGFDEIIKV